MLTFGRGVGEVRADGVVLDGDPLPVAFELARRSGAALSLYADLPYATNLGWPTWVTGEAADPTAPAVAALFAGVTAKSGDMEGYAVSATAIVSSTGSTTGEDEEGATTVFTLSIADAAGYTMVKKNWFNGVKMPGIVVKELDGSLTVAREFGYDDFTASHAELRHKWIASGMPWWSVVIKRPSNWSADQQLLNLRPKPSDA